jgi:hypothetical protein
MAVNYVVGGGGTAGPFQKVFAQILDSNNEVLDNNSQLTQSIENNSSGMAVYIGEAAPGTAKNAAGWRIKKISYDSSNAVTDIQWANGTNTFTKVWDSRAGYSYS